MLSSRPATRRPTPRNGTTMTAKEVKWSIEKIIGLNNEAFSTRCGGISEFVNLDRADNGLELVDNLTINVHLSSPFANLSSFLGMSFCGIVP
ncbi:MAG: hypothetical protein HY680_08225 [Chloroflexi bacterium]|nr:hypothetical protein [Chloroflexota bacterium]